MTDVKICEQDGIYTAYHIELKRGPDGRLEEVPVSIFIPIPNAEDMFSLKDWAAALTDEQVNVGVQIFFDKWNFSSGDGRHKLILEVLTSERDERELDKPDPKQYNLFNTWPTAPNTNPPAKKKRFFSGSTANKMQQRLKKIGLKNNKTVAVKKKKFGGDLTDKIRQRMKEKVNGI